MQTGIGMKFAESLISKKKEPVAEFGGNCVPSPMFSADEGPKRTVFTEIK